MVELITKEKSQTSYLESGLHEMAVEQPGWLLTTYESSIWKLREDVKGYSKAHYTISWEYPVEKELSDRSPYWTVVAKLATYHCMESSKTECKKTTTLVLYAREIRSFCFWLCSERKCLNLAAISKNDVEAYEAYIMELCVKKNTANTKMLCLKLLWTLRKEMGDGLSFNPYVRSRSLSRKAKKIGLVGGHTPTILPNDLFSMIDFALDRLNNSKEIIELFGIYHAERLRLASSTGSRGYRNKTGLSAMDLRKQVQVLYGAAIVIKLIFTGERKHELAYSKYSDVIQLLSGEVDELKGTVSKTAKTPSGKSTSRPVVKELLQALQVIVDLTAFTRAEYEGDSLVLKLPLKADEIENHGAEVPTRVLYGFLDYFSVEASNGKLKKLRPHMLRRAFSMLWAWRFEVGDLYYLSKLLHHNTEVFTKAYTEDEDVFEFLPEAYQALMYDILEGALLGKSSIHGGVGKLMRRYGRVLQSQVTVVTPESAHRFVDSFVKRHDYKIVPQADGFCLIEKSREKYAKCSTDGKKPNYANRSDKACLECVNFGVTETRKSLWNKRKIAHEAVFNSTDIEILQQASLEGIERAETVIRWVSNDDE
jgi:integrase